MREELLKKSIQQLKAEELELKKAKTTLFIELDIAQKEVKFSNENNIRIQSINNDLNKSNELLSDNLTELDGKIVLSRKNENELIENIEKSNKSLKILDLRALSLVEDITVLNKDKTSLTMSNSKLNKENLLKNTNLEQINKNITKRENILNWFNKKIQSFKDREEYLTEKNNKLLIKDSRLNTREIRLNEFKKFLLEKKHI